MLLDPLYGTLPPYESLRQKLVLLLGNIPVQVTNITPPLYIQPSAQTVGVLLEDN